MKSVKVVLLVAMACLGIWSFIDLGMPGYLSLHAQFAFADAEKPLALSLVQFAAVGSTIATVSSMAFR